MNKSDKNVCNLGTFILVSDRENKINTKVISTIKKKKGEEASHVILNKLVKEGIAQDFTETIFLPTLKIVASKKSVRSQ